MDNKPISPKAHGMIDYGFLGMMLAAPSLLKFQGPAKTLPYLFGGVQGLLNAFTDQPFAIKRVVPFPLHGKIDKWSSPVLVALPLLTGAWKQPKARAFFGGSLALLVTTYLLTDWTQKPDA